MRMVLFIVVVASGIVALLRRALPAEQRVRWQENISGVPGAMMERVLFRYSIVQGKDS